MCRIICHTARMDERSIDAAYLSFDVIDGEPPFIDSIEQLVNHLRTRPRLTFRCVGFDGIEVHWQHVGPATAQVYECQRGRLLRVHLLSRGPTGEVWWEKSAMNNLPSDASDLLALSLNVPSFAEWSHRPESELQATMKHRWADIGRGIIEGAPHAQKED